MSKTRNFVEQAEAMLAAWCGPKQYARLNAVCPGAATGELFEKLRASDKKDWYEICRQHAKERAEDVCWYFKPGDLFYRDGDYLWNMYWMEIERALRAVGAGRVRKRRGLDAAREGFVETVERIRIQRIGTPDERKAKEEAGYLGIEFSETLSEAYERMQKGERTRVGDAQ